MFPKKEGVRGPLVDGQARQKEAGVSRLLGRGKEYDIWRSGLWQQFSKYRIKGGNAESAEEDDRVKEQRCRYSGRKTV